MGGLVHSTGGLLEVLVHRNGSLLGGLVHSTDGLLGGYGRIKLTLGDETSDSITNCCSAWAIVCLVVQGMQSSQMQGGRSSCLE